MATQSYPLIGIDRHGHQHEIEGTGPTAKLAAQSVLRQKGYMEVLNGDKRNKLRDYRHLLARRPNSEFPARAEALGSAIQSAQTTAVQTLLTQVRQKGLRVSLVEGRVAISPKGKLSDTDRAAMREHEAAIIQLLKLEQPAPQTTAPETATAAETPSSEQQAVPDDPYKGITRKDVLAKILPQMPTPFTTAHFCERLIAAGFMSFAHDSARVSNAMTLGMQLGWVRAIKRGTYQVEPRFKERPAGEGTGTQADAQAALNGTEPEMKGADSKPQAAPAPADIAVNGKPQLTMELPITPPVPPQAPLPTRTLIPSSGLPTPALQALLLLSSQALVTEGHDEQMARTLLEAVGTFQTTILQAAEALEATIKPIALRLQMQAKLQKDLTAALAGMRTETSR